MNIKTLSMTVALFLVGSLVRAEDMPMRQGMGMDGQMPGMQMDHQGMSHEGHGMGHMSMKGMYGSYPMTREASGTSWQPDSSQHEGLHFMTKDWMVMMHGYMTGIYDNQGGKRGDEKWFANSMLMTMAQRPLRGGTLGLRSMLSLDPATIGKQGYPNLLQTGETADGQMPLIDRQHPHDLFMEMAGTYSHPHGEDQSGFVYFGYPGEPALGPVTFMHRFSGIEIPDAPITHHWLDSTHITFGVATAGYVWKNVKLETSRFTGREPNQYRWDFDHPKFDSYSGRISYNPMPNWSFQGSYGHIVSPEQLQPDQDQNRWTASATYNRPFAQNNWQTTFAWGQNQNMPGRRLDGYLLESTLNVMHMHTFFVRGERVAKDELFDAGSPQAGEEFTIHKVGCGYIYDLPAWQHVQAGVGGEGSVALIPASLYDAYGKNPLSFMLFVRLKLI